MMRSQDYHKLTAQFLDELKLMLRVTSDVYDHEILIEAEAALRDMERVGIREDYIKEANASVRHAVACYVKANFGYDNEEADRFNRSYRQMVIDMLNSDKNKAYNPEEGE